MEITEVRKARNDDIVLYINRKIKNGTVLVIQSETDIAGSSKTLKAKENEQKNTDGPNNSGVSQI